MSGRGRLAAEARDVLDADREVEHVELLLLRLRQLLEPGAPRRVQPRLQRKAVRRALRALRARVTTIISKDCGDDEECDVESRLVVLARGAGRRAKRLF